MNYLHERTSRDLRRLVVDRQRDGRVPGVFAGVVRGGGLAWSTGIGAKSTTDLDIPPGPDDQFLIASNTKTFTAVLVMQLRDEGKLSLDDTLDQFFPVTKYRGLTIRQCLSHSSGMQREPVGDVWETLESPDASALLRDFERAERVHAPHRLWHTPTWSSRCSASWSRTSTGVAGRSASERASSTRSRCGATSVGLDGPHVQGYYVPPFSDVPVREPVLDLRAMAPCGGLASTGEDMARWSAFVADPVDEVLSAATLEEMCRPQIHD